MAQFPRLDGESYQDWLKRALNVGAEPHVITAIQTLLQDYLQQSTPPPAGKYYISRRRRYSQSTVLCIMYCERTKPCQMLFF